MSQLARQALSLVSQRDQWVDMRGAPSASNVCVIRNTAFSLVLSS